MNKPLSRPNPEIIVSIAKKEYSLKHDEEIYTVDDNCILGFDPVRENFYFSTSHLNRYGYPKKEYRSDRFHEYIYWMTIINLLRNDGYTFKIVAKGNNEREAILFAFLEDVEKCIREVNKDYPDYADRFTQMMRGVKLYA